MKKLLWIAFFMCVTAAISFAQSYTVQSVTGRVQREANGTRVDVKVGETLTAETVIHTGIGAALTLSESGRTLTVPAARSGKVAELSTAASGVRISGNVTQVNTDAVSRTTGQVSTASARASNAAQDENIAAE
jgi:hypothetical protein